MRKKWKMDMLRRINKREEEQLEKVERERKREYVQMRENKRVRYIDREWETVRTVRRKER